MATVALTPEECSYTGMEGHSDTGEYDAATATDGFEFVNDGNTIIHIKNADAGTITATVDNPQACNFGGTTVHDVEVSIPQNEDFLIGPFPTHRFNATSTGKVTVRLTEHTDVTAISARAIKFV
jgi:hypothetical protein